MCFTSYCQIDTSPTNLRFKSLSCGNVWRTAVSRLHDWRDHRRNDMAPRAWHLPYLNNLAPREVGAIPYGLCGDRLIVDIGILNELVIEI